ncbi:MAG: TolC family protein [Kiritimatiellales bacterium]
MKHILFFLMIPGLLSAQTNMLTLSDVRRAVLDSNPSIRESLQRILAAEAVLRQAKSAYLPTVSLSGSYGATDTSRHPEADIQHRYRDSFNQLGGSLQANWVLFDGFARRARTLSATYDVRRTEQLADDTRRLLLLSATASFRQAQLAAENVRVLEQDRHFNRILEDDARKRFNAGSVPETDVFNFSIRALQAESSVFQAQLDYQTACTVLAELMALPDGRLPDTMQPAVVNADLPETQPVPDNELQYALAHRPDYQAVESGRLALEQQVRVAKGNLLPNVSLIGSVNYTENENVSSVENYGDYDSFIGIGAQWDLFSGGRKMSEIIKAMADLRALGEQREALRLSIRSGIQSRIDEARTARAVFEKQKQIYDLSVKVRDSVEKSYKAGVATITRLNEAQTDLTRAEGAVASARISSLLALEQLDAETGRILETP